MLMFIYAVKIEGVRSCMACMIEQILIMSVRQRGTSLGVKTAVTIHQQAKFTSRSLARDREAAKVTGGGGGGGGMYVLLSVQLLAM